MITYQQTLSALADPTRRDIFERLRLTPSSVGELAAGLPVSRPAVSQHLRVLRKAGLVEPRKAGTRRIYSVELRGLKELRDYLDGFWTDVLEAFKAEAEQPGPGDLESRQGEEIES